MPGCPVIPALSARVPGECPSQELFEICGDIWRNNGHEQGKDLCTHIRPGRTIPVTIISSPAGTAPEHQGNKPGQEYAGADCCPCGCAGMLFERPANRTEGLKRSPDHGLFQVPVRPGYQELG